MLIAQSIMCIRTIRQLEVKYQMLKVLNPTTYKDLDINEKGNSHARAP